MTLPIVSAQTAIDQGQIIIHSKVTVKQRLRLIEEENPNMARVISMLGKSNHDTMAAMIFTYEVLARQDELNAKKDEVGV